MWWWSRFRGLSLWTRMPAHVGCWCPECESADVELHVMKKPSVKLVEGADAIVRVEVPVTLKKFPTLVEVLCQPGWADGDAKGESALMLFRKGTAFRAILKVETPPLSLSVPGRDLDDVLASLEAILRGEEIPWEQDANPLGRRSGKKRQAS